MGFFLAEIPDAKTKLNHMKHRKWINGFVSAEILEYEMGRKTAKIAETEKMVCLPEPWEKRVFASVGFDIRNQRREEIAMECVRHGCSPTETGDDLQF